MIFIANVLVMNGGTTFLVRLIQERSRRGQPSIVLLLTNRVDEKLVETLGKEARILRLSDYLVDHGLAARGLLGVFAPIAHRRLAKDLERFGTHVHAMGLFGLIFGMRLVSYDQSLRLTAGIYHQNEFMYKPPPFYFAHKGLDLFAALPSKNVIFFNESSRQNYGKHFIGQNYDDAHLLPIGIQLDEPPAPRMEGGRQRIVSIGNLFPFKTYNRHMIGVVSALRDRFPDIRYDIYGVGPMADELTTLATSLGVSDRVTLHGALEYDQLRHVIEECDLFVGSGTALIEAAAVGRPALIGIESIEQPETYGYLSDARGFSYNENMPDVPKQRILPLVERLFSDEAHWSAVAAACAAKAHDFSIAATADGMDAAGAAALPPRLKLSGAELIRLATSAVTMRVSELLGRSDPFGNRHDQSY